MALSRTTSRRVAACAALATGSVHALLTPVHLREVPLLGALFLVAAVCCADVAVRLWRGDDLQAWWVGAGVCAGMATGYVASRTVGLFSMHEAWDGPGLLSLLADGVFVVAAAGRIPARRTRTAGTLAAASALVAGLLAPGSAVAYGWSSSGTTCANSGCTTEYAVPLPIPAVLAPTSTDATTDYYTLNEQTANVSVVPGRTTPMWTYNGTFPGPVIRSTSGRSVKVHVNNVNLPEATTLHMHGAHVAPSSDGDPVATVGAGGSQDYTYPNDQSARIQWFHDHAKDLTGKHVYMGLAGMYLIGDSQEAALNLPTGAYDVPLVVQDRQFNSDGTLNYTLSSSSMRSGFLGDTLLVNGAPQPYFKVATHRYRLRLLNGSNARSYTFALGSGAIITEIGNEAGLFSAPVAAPSVTLPPAGRADVIVDFSRTPVGTSVVLKNTQGSGSTADVLRFDVATPVGDTTGVPTAMRPFTPLSTSSVTATRTFSIAQNNGVWQFNALSYDPLRVDAKVALGAVEQWTFTNRSGQSHPIHLHDINFQVLKVNGSAPTGDQAQWKETVDVPAWGSVTVIGQFADFTGTYLFHCHILEHEDNMLMSQFGVS